MNWPSNSPDLNPIENLWSFIKHNVDKHMPADINKSKAIFGLGMGKILLPNLVSLIDRRYQMIIDGSSERINY